MSDARKRTSRTKTRDSNMKEGLYRGYDIAQDHYRHHERHRPHDHWGHPRGRGRDTRHASDRALRSVTELAGAVFDLMWVAAQPFDAFRLRESLDMPMSRRWSRFEEDDSDHTCNRIRVDITSPVASKVSIDMPGYVGPHDRGLEVTEFVSPSGEEAAIDSQIRAYGDDLHLQIRVSEKQPEGKYVADVLDLDGYDVGGITLELGK